jgi:hypothetical protein
MFNLMPFSPVAGVAVFMIDLAPEVKEGKTLYSVSELGAR